MSQIVGVAVEFVVVGRLIYAHAPKNDGGVIAILGNHLTHVFDGDILPCIVANMLPTGKLCHNQKTQLITLIYKIMRLRIVGCANSVDAQLLL